VAEPTPSDPTPSDPTPSDPTARPGDPGAPDVGPQPYAPANLAAKPDVGAEGFFALDLRVGHIVEVTPFPEARLPAWKLRVDFGPIVGVLQTSAQITNYPETELLGRQVVGAVNLGAKRIAGFRSEFLILGGLEPDGTVKLLGVDGRLDPGAPVA
jgi:tRNA-binding protein